MATLDSLKTMAIAALGDPRRRALLAILGLVLSAQLFLAVGDWAGAGEASLARLTSERRRAAGLAAAARNESVAEAARKAMGEAADWSFAGPTFSIARLRAHQSLEAAMQTAGLANAGLRAEGEAQGAEQIRFAAFVIEGPFDWPSFLSFIDALIGLEEGASIEAFAVSPGAAARFRLVVKVPLIEAAPAGEAS